MSDILLNDIKKIFGDKLEISEKSRTRIYLNAGDKEIALKTVRYLFIDKGLRFSIASGVDTREGIEILYHMADDKNNRIISVRVLAKKPFPEMPSVSGFMPAAEWIEREIHELLGVNFPGHPGLKKLLLPDDWPDGVYPLRKGQ